MQLTGEFVQKALPEAVYDAPSAVFTGVTTDSRKVQKGDLFIALKGEKYNGHSFCKKAIEAGAGAVMVSESAYAIAGKSILVPDTLAAYQKLARSYRLSFPQLKVVAITGSNGKTSTKDLVASCLSKRYNTVKTVANFNNEIGLPQTLFTITPEAEVCVVEIGMRGLGQIRALRPLAEPDVVVITNVGENHLELLGSKENIAQAKAEILEGLTLDKMAILNYDDPYVSKMHTGARVVSFGLEDKCSVRGKILKESASGIEFTYSSKVTGAEQCVTLPLIGKHNVLNALAAVAVAESLGVPDELIADALFHAQVTGKRQEVVTLGEYVFINDAYNASPASMRAALQTLLQVATAKHSRAVAVLADMLELGEESVQFHYEVGRYAAQLGVELLATYGPLSVATVQGAKDGGITALHFPDRAAAVDALRTLLCAGDVILLKGSHAMGVDGIMDELRK